MAPLRYAIPDHCVLLIKNPPFAGVRYALRPCTFFVAVVPIVPLVHLAVVLIYRKATDERSPAQATMIVPDPFRPHEFAVLFDEVSQGFVSRFDISR